jgi:hypothetical protein
MAYFKRSLVRRPGRIVRSAMVGLGAFTDSDQCSTIPIGDPYRKPGNYCATPDGGTTTFNADGSTYRAPGAVDPDPAHPAGAASSSGSLWDRIAAAAGAAVGAKQVTPYPVPIQTGMSTTTMVALAGGAVLLAVLLARR